jgi:hypothetical protein
MSDDFYETLPASDRFADMAEPERFAPLPEDWLVGVSDIAGSTGLIEAGRYKTVNMVGAAVISAVMNALDGAPFPFIFGGDGAGFAVWPGAEDRVRSALAATARWAMSEFGITLLVALVPARDCAAAGLPVRVARFRAAPEAHYAMFAGGGLSWAEAQMKAGAYAIEPAPEGTSPDLTGLSCRWSHMQARHGMILSLVVQPASDDRAGFADVAGAVIEIAYPLEREGHPAPVAGPGAGWPPPGATLEAHAQRRGRSLVRARMQVWFETLVAWALIRTGLKPGGFDARRYARVVGENADFRKFEDGLKMTIDCDEETRDRIVAVLDDAALHGIVRFGVSEQSEAMMTCIVPSFMRDDHVHFIDGASGGYTLAAARMKAAAR